MGDIHHRRTHRRQGRPLAEQRREYQGVLWNWREIDEEVREFERWLRDREDEQPEGECGE